MELFVVIMAGGVGARFWPRSKQHKPKQLLKIFGENTMIQDTVQRLHGLVKTENILIITNRIQKPRLMQQLPEVPEQNIIDEPFGKNTAPCIGLAAALIQSKSPKAVMITLPADHLIQDRKEFQKVIKHAASFANKSGGLVTVGINPTRPETGYGYIQIGDEETNGIYEVKTFAEKPNLATAKRFISAGDFMWNSGMFVWKVDAILDEIRIYLPDLFDGLQEIKKDIGKTNFVQTLTSVYGQLKSISIDYGIMEKSKNVYLVKGDFDWNDVGSWEAVYQLSEKDDDNNARSGDVYLGDTTNSYVFSPNKFTAVIGLENVIVIDTKDALLVCDRQHAQNVKNVVDYLKMNNRNELV